MNPLFRKSLVGAACAAAFALAGPVSAAGWASLSPDQQGLLAPVAGEWEGLDAARQARLARLAERAAAAGPEAAATFLNRLATWQALSPEERAALANRPLRLKQRPADAEPGTAAKSLPAGEPLLSFSLKSATEGDIVTNPGAFTWAIIGGALALGENAFDLASSCDEDEDPLCEPSEPPTFPVDIEADGRFTVPPGAVLLPPIELEFGSDVVTISFELPQQPRGTIDPTSGDATLDVDLSIRLQGVVSGVNLGNNCRIGTPANPVRLRATTGESAGELGTPYDRASSTLTVVDNTFAVPGASSCGGFLSFIVTPILNGELNLPSPAGNNRAALTFEILPAVLGPNEPPVALPQTVETFVNTAVAITLTGQDPDGDSLSFEIVDGPANGTLDISALPVVSYLPNANFEGSDSFSFRALDGQAASEPATVTINVVQPPVLNEPPVAQPQAVSTLEDTPVAITLTGTDPNGDALSFAVVDGPANGTLDVSALPVVVYTPAPGFVGADSFRFVANDGELESEPATVSITVIAANKPPVANPQQVVTRGGQPVSITVSGSDPDGDALGFRIVQQPANGTLVRTGPASWVYTPATGFGGVDSFRFVANDGALDSAPAEVRITVEALATALSAEPALVNLRLLGLLSSINLGEMRATLVDENGQPVAGKTLSFSVSGEVRCTAVTDATGTAGCRGGTLSGVLSLLLQAGYEVRFAGDAGYTPSVASGRLVR